MFNTVFNSSKSWKRSFTGKQLQSTAEREIPRTIHESGNVSSKLLFQTVTKTFDKIHRKRTGKKINIFRLAFLGSFWRLSKSNASADRPHCVYANLALLVMGTTPRCFVKTVKTPGGFFFFLPSNYINIIIVFFYFVTDLKT